MNGGSNNLDIIQIILLFVTFSLAIVGMCTVAIHSDLGGDIVTASHSICIFSIDEQEPIGSVSNVVSSNPDEDAFVINDVIYRTCGEDVAEVLGFVGYPATDLVIPPEVTSPDGTVYVVVDIADEAFRDMAPVESVVIPDTITEVGRNSFRGCVSLISLTAPITLECHHGDDGYAFKDVLLENLTLTRGTSGLPREDNEFWSPMSSILKVLVVDEDITSFTTTFRGSTHLESVKLKDVESIVEDQFRDCPSLRTVVAPKVRAVDDNAFMDCPKLNTVDLSSLESLTRGIFVHCTSLRTVISDMLFIDNGQMFMVLDDDSVSLIQQLDADPSLIDIPVEVASPSGMNYTVTEIGKEAFRMQENLKILFVDGGVSKVDEHAFLDCKSLYTISIPIGIDCPPYTGKAAFEGVKPMTLVLTSEGYDPEKYMNNEFWKPFRNSLKNLFVGEGITDFRTSFKGTKLTSVVMDDVETVNESQFENCRNLYIASFPEALTVKNSAFKNCEELLSVDSSKAKSIGDEAFSRCYIFYDFLGDSVETIGEKGFYGCIPLSEFNFDNIKKVGSKAFYDTAVTNAPLSKSHCFAKDAFGSSIEVAVKVKTKSTFKKIRLGISTTLAGVGTMASAFSISRAIKDSTDIAEIKNTITTIEEVTIPKINEDMVIVGLDNPVNGTFQFEIMKGMNEDLIKNRLKVVHLKRDLDAISPTFWKTVAKVVVVVTVVVTIWSIAEWNTNT